MSNNLACYPLMRRGRDIDIVIAFDSSADIQTSNWISYTEGYAKQRKIQGWPVSMGWPPVEPEKAVEQLVEAQADNRDEAEQKLVDAQRANGDAADNKVAGLAETRHENNKEKKEGEEEAPTQVRVIRLLEKEEVQQREWKKKHPLGSLTIWVGSKEEREADDEPPPTESDDEEEWSLIRPEAGMTLPPFPSYSLHPIIYLLH